MSPTAVPIEIYENIIKLVFDEDKRLMSMKACSLVSHDFFSLARKHIFRTINLNATTNTEAFVRLILRTPKSAEHVRTLNLIVGLKDFSLNQLPHILKKLTLLKSLTLFQNRFERPLNWTDVPLPLKDAFLSLFRLPTLSHLTLGPINRFIIPDLINCSNLKYLNMRNVRFDPIDPSAQRYYQPILSYPDMNDDLCGGGNADGTLIIDFGHHQVKELLLSKDLQTKITALFTLCSQLMDIRAYKINYGLGMMLIKGFAATVGPSLQTLQHLHFHFKVTAEYNDPLGGLPGELAAIAGINVVESISINIMVETDHNCSTGDEWGALDRALTQPRSGWPNLKSVSLKIAVVSCQRKDGVLEEALRKLPQGQLKNLTKDFKFELEVQSYFEDSYVDSDSSVSEVMSDLD